MPKLIPIAEVPVHKPKPEMTTIAISKQNARQLAGMRHGYEDYDAVISRLLNNQLDVTTEMILIDNELPQLHTCVMQLGEDIDSLYFFDGKEFTPISLENANKLLKQPKPNMTINREQANIIYTNYYHIKRVKGTATPAEEEIHAQLQKFLGVE